MSRRNIIKRAKIKRGQMHSAIAWLEKELHKRAFEYLCRDHGKIDYLGIRVQPVSQLTEQQRLQRYAPRIEVAIGIKEEDGCTATNSRPLLP